MLISKKSIFIVLMVMTIFSCGKTQNNEEIEPNNTISTATLIEPGRDCSGLLDSENDIDNFLLKIDEEQVVRIELTGVKGLNHAIEVWKLNPGNPIPVKTVDDNRKSSPEEMANLNLVPGDYIIVVTHGSRDVKKGNPENRYTLRVTSRSPFNEEKEPNDNPGMANMINNGDSVAGYFSPSRNMLNENQQFSYREEDWFRADIVSGEENPVTVDFNLSGVNGVDSILVLYDSEMKELASSDNAAAGGAEIISGLGIKSSGTYYIMVASKSYQYNHREPYQLSFRTNIHDSGSELEPNNGFDNAGRVSGNLVAGKINYAGDQDYFYFEEIKGDNIKLRLQSDPGLDAVMTVYSTDRTKLIEANNAGAGYEEIIPALFTGDGIYVKVNSANPSSADMSYRLNFEQIYIDGESEKEPNNSLKEANQIDRNISGFTSVQNDKDYYIIRTRERIKYKINASGPQNGTIRISTTDQMGYIIKTKTIVNGESVSFQELFDKKGYIIVETVIPDFENYYTISIEETK